MIIKKFLLFFFGFFLFIIPAYSFSETYFPIASNDYLYKKDIPVFIGLEETLKRLENRNKNHKIWALNLSGGSARAFAHIGVLKRLEEEGLRPDVIITDSMGSIVGLTYAAGMKISDIEDVINSITISHYFDLVFPSGGGIISVRRFRALIKTIFGDLDISETPIPVFVVTEDIKTKRQVIISKGDFNKVLSASFALPVYFNPVNFGEYRLIDGGISNLVPIKPFHKFLPDMVVSSTFYNTDLNLYNPITILNVSMDIGKTRKAVRQIKQYDPFLIRCDVEDISYMAFEDSKKIIKKGYDSCNEVMPSLLNYLKERNIFPSPTPLESFPQSGKYRENWAKIKNKLDYIDLPTDGTDISSSINLLDWKTYGSRHLLKEDFLLGETNWYRSNNFGIGAGIFSDMDGTPGIKLSINYGAGNLLFMDLTALYSRDIYAGTSHFDNLYLFGNIYSVLSSGKMIIRPSVIMENSTDLSADITRSRVSPGTTWDFSFSGIEFEQYIGCFYNVKDNGETGSGIKAENTASIPVSKLLTFKTRQMAEFSLGHDTRTAKLSYSDFLRSSTTTLFSDSDSYYDSYTVFNNSINWRAGAFLPTLAEMFILDKTDLFIFTDIFVNSILPGQSKRNIKTSSGAGINMKASLIGLKPWVLTVLGGYDFFEDKLFFSLNFN